MTKINRSLSYYISWSTIFHGFGREVVEVGARLRLGLLALIDLSASITESRANFDLNRVVVTEKKKKKVSEPWTVDDDGVDFLPTTTATKAMMTTTTTTSATTLTVDREERNRLYLKNIESKKCCNESDFIATKIMNSKLNLWTRLIKRLD